MYNDADVETYAKRLRSPDSAVRALAADEATDGVSDWGHHSFTEPQADRITRALVDALATESDDRARESIVNALASLARLRCLVQPEILLANTGPPSKSGIGADPADLEVAHGALEAAARAGVR